jgi:excisionase family DNA binding protein
MAVTGDREDDALVDYLIERSSLGTAGARQLRERIPQAEAEAIRLAAALRPKTERDAPVAAPPEQSTEPDASRERLLTVGEVAALFRVDPKTVTRWAASGRIKSVRTPGGHRRFRESEVRALLRGVKDLAADE